MTDKAALVTSSAGMRLIALLTLYNGGDFQRLRDYLAASFAPALLAHEPVAVRLAALRLLMNRAGRLRVRQVIGADKYHVVVILAAERDPDAALICDVAVAEDHPHLIRAFVLA